MASILAAFLSASSMMNPQLFLYTLGGIGLEMAVVRLLTVLLFAVLLGLILYRIPEEKVTRQTIRTAAPIPVSPLVKTRSFSLLFQNSLKSLEYVGFYMVIGVLAAAVVEVLFPIQSMLALLKPGRWEAVLLADLLGIPLYVCGGGTIPLISSMLEAGMAKGAALSFFLAGGGALRAGAEPERQGADHGRIRPTDESGHEGFEIYQGIHSRRGRFSRHPLTNARYSCPGRQPYPSRSSPMTVF